MQKTLNDLETRIKVLEDLHHNLQINDNYLILKSKIDYIAKYIEESIENKIIALNKTCEIIMQLNIPNLQEKIIRLENIANNHYVISQNDKIAELEEGTKSLKLEKYTKAEELIFKLRNILG